MAPHTTFEGSFAWSRQWNPLLKILIGPHILREGNEIEDQNLATDMTLLKAGEIVVACRVRSPGYAQRYGNQVTVTCKRETGALDESKKILFGTMGDLFFYGHATTDSVSNGGTIAPWFLVDLRRARPWMQQNHGPMLGPNKDRHGKRCWFYAFDVPRMIAVVGREVIVAATWFENLDQLPLLSTLGICIRCAGAHVVQTRLLGMTAFTCAQCKHQWAEA